MLLKQEFRLLYTTMLGLRAGPLTQEVTSGAIALMAEAVRKSSNSMIVMVRSTSAESIHKKAEELLGDLADVTMALKKLSSGLLWAQDVGPGRLESEEEHIQAKDIINQWFDRYGNEGRSQSIDMGTLGENLARASRKSKRRPREESDPVSAGMDNSGKTVKLMKGPVAETIKDLKEDVKERDIDLRRVNKKLKGYQEAIEGCGAACQEKVEEINRRREERRLAKEYKEEAQGEERRPRHDVFRTLATDLPDSDEEDEPTIDDEPKENETEQGDGPEELDEPEKVDEAEQKKAQLKADKARLKEREGEVEGKEARLKAKEVRLTAVEARLKKQEGETEEKAARLIGKAGAAVERATRLQALEARIKEREGKAAEREGKAEENKAQIDAYAARVSEHHARTNRSAAVLREAVLEAETRKEAWKKEKDAWTKAQQAVFREEAARLAEKETRANDMEARLKAEEALLSEQQAWVNRDQALAYEKVNAMEAVMNAKEAVLNAKEAVLNVKEAVLNAKEADLIAREAVLNARNADLNAQEAALNAKEAVLNEQEAPRIEQETALQEEREEALRKEKESRHKADEGEPKEEARPGDDGDQPAVPPPAGPPGPPGPPQPGPVPVAPPQVIVRRYPGPVVWLCVALAIFAIALALQSYITTSRERKMWFAANGLTRKHLLQYAFYDWDEALGPRWDVNFMVSVAECWAMLRDSFCAVVGDGTCAVLGGWVPWLYDEVVCAVVEPWRHDPPEPPGPVVRPLRRCGETWFGRQALSALSVVAELALTAWATTKVSRVLRMMLRRLGPRGQRLAAHPYLQ